LFDGCAFVSNFAAGGAVVVLSAPNGEISIQNTNFVSTVGGGGAGAGTAPVSNGGAACFTGALVYVNRSTFTDSESGCAGAAFFGGTCTNGGSGSGGGRLYLTDSAFNDNQLVLSAASCHATGTNQPYGGGAIYWTLPGVIVENKGNYFKGNLPNDIGPPTAF
jgi:hypothetical protein